MTDTKTLTRETPPDPTDKAAEPKRLLDLSATQLAGGALAAMTSAVIGAQLGVAGTIAGAAVGSLVAGVAGSVYTASLKRGREKITSVFVGRVGDTKVEVTTVSDQPLAVQALADQGAAEDSPVGHGASPGGWDLTQTQSMAAVAPPSGDSVAADALVDQRGQRTRRLSWKAILVSTAAVFLLALAGLTLVELVSGQAVSGGEGTTITQVREGRSGGSDTPSQAPSQSASEESQPSSVPSASSEPSDSASSQPSAEPTQEPSGNPTTSSEPSTSSEPTDNVTPSTAGDQGTNDPTDGAVAGG